MLKRMLFMLGVVAVLLGSLGFVKYRQIQTAIAQGASFQPPPTAVTTIVAQRETWPTTLDIIGTVEAIHGVTVSADLPGAVAKIYFDSGQWVHEGDILVDLDTRQEQAQLMAKTEFDNVTAQQKVTEGQVGEIRATIARKTIRAPFSGVLGIRQVNLGQYLAAGQAIVSLQSLDPIYVNFGVPQQNTGQVGVGRTLRITSNDFPGLQFTGRVTALDSVVNESTRNLQVQTTLSNSQNKLRPGMFVQVSVGLGANTPVIVLPASAINYAPYGDSVFVVTDLKDDKGKTYRGVRQQIVKLGGSRGDQVGVVSGINPGDEVVSSGVFKLRNGAAVQINNKVQPDNNSHPKPEDS
jgi:membrane fusion protein, multidrug efflux system